jgi:hypothetical protein
VYIHDCIKIVNSDFEIVFLSRAKRLKFGFAESPVVELAVFGAAFAWQ